MIGGYFKIPEELFDYKTDLSAQLNVFESIIN